MRWTFRFRFAQGILSGIKYLGIKLNLETSKSLLKVKAKDNFE